MYSSQQSQCHTEANVFLSQPVLNNWTKYHTNEVDQQQQKTPWPESASELYRPSDRRLSAKIVPTFADRGCNVVGVTDPYGRILGFLDQCRYFFFQVDSQLYTQGRVGPVPDPLLLRKSGSTIEPEPLDL
jgi:hypothetical protein